MSWTTRLMPWISFTMRPFLELRRGDQVGGHAVFGVQRADDHPEQEAIAAAGKFLLELRELMRHGESPDRQLAADALELVQVGMLDWLISEAAGQRC
jgi:hypothetical protein